jgi:putative ABC transport system permease protein
MATELLLAARTLRRSPTFAAVSIVALALGLGANATLFSVADAVLLRPLPFVHADQMVIAGESLIEPRSEITYRDFESWRSGATTFDGMAAIGSTNWSWRLRTATDQVEVRYRVVSGDLFDLLGSHALLGRALHADDDRRGAKRVVVLSHGFWRSRFGGDADIVGRSVTLNDTSFDVVGVMPLDFRFPSGVDMDSART